MISPPVIGLIILMVSSAYGMVIQCRYQLQHYIYRTPTIDNFYSCVVTGMSFENPNIVEGITGNHAAGMNDSDVRGFNVIFCQYWGHCPYSIPKNIGIFFPNLQILSWTRSYLDVITSEALQSMPNLLSLELHWNSLRSLDSDLFQYTRKIVLVDFRMNKIRHFGNDTFTDIKDLTTLRLYDNACVVRDYEGEAEIEAAKLELPILCPLYPYIDPYQPHSPYSPYSPYPYLRPTTVEPTTLTPSTTSIEEQCLHRCSLDEDTWTSGLSLLNTKFDERLAFQSQRIAALEKQLGMDTGKKLIV